MSSLNCFSPLGLQIGISDYGKGDFTYQISEAAGNNRMKYFPGNVEN